MAKLSRASYVDDLVYARLSALRLPPSGQATDLERIRRVTLRKICHPEAAEPLRDLALSRWITQ